MTLDLTHHIHTEMTAKESDKKNALPLYAILDGARNPEIYPLVVSSYSEFVSLFTGIEDEELVAASPYLIRLTHDTHFTRQLISRAWGQSWAVFLTSEEDIETLRKHFRHFLRIKGPDGKPLFFRFYDPRVLRTFFDVATKDQLTDFYKKITRFILEDQDPQNLLSYRFSGTELDKMVISLKDN